tara:strand:- start:10409 stop:10675 length:267 start_codon:yes stop_codon:yes gene_type:complete
MAKPMEPVICGLTGVTITEWRDRLWINIYENGKNKPIPLYISKQAVLDAHNSSPTKAERASAEAVADTDTSEDASVDTSEEVSAGSPY